jgi:hypothetical protein
MVPAPLARVWLGGVPLWEISIRNLEKKKLLLQFCATTWTH